MVLCLVISISRDNCGVLQMLTDSTWNVQTPQFSLDSGPAFLPTLPHTLIEVIRQKNNAHETSSLLHAELSESQLHRTHARDRMISTRHQINISVPSRKPACSTPTVARRTFLLRRKIFLNSHGLLLFGPTKRTPKPITTCSRLRLLLLPRHVRRVTAAVAMEEAHRNKTSALTTARPCAVRSQKTWHLRHILPLVANLPVMPTSN